MQTTPTTGLLHQLSDLLQPRVQPQPQATDERTPPPRKMVTAPRTVHEATAQTRNLPAGPHDRPTSRSQAPDVPTRDIPRGSFLNIVV